MSDIQACSLKSGVTEVHLKGNPNVLEWNWKGSTILEELDILELEKCKGTAVDIVVEKGNFLETGSTYFHTTRNNL